MTCKQNLIYRLITLKTLSRTQMRINTHKIGKGH